MKRSWVISCVVCLASLHASAAVWYVNKANSTPGAGTSWATAFTTIQPAINAALGAGGGDIWIAEGTYNEPRSDPTGALVLKENVRLYGGFVGGETTLSARNWNDHVVTIDGSHARGGSAGFHAVMGANQARLDGLSITGGNANDTGSNVPTKCGGGLFCSAVSMSIAHCRFVNNQALNYGSAFYCELGSCEISDTIFENNGSGDVTGCAYFYTCSAVSLAGCVFQGNTGFASAGFANAGSTVTASGCMFKDNVGINNGAICNSFNGTLTLTNCVFLRNQAEGRFVGYWEYEGYGGALQNSQATLHCMNCTFTGNSVSNGYGGAIDNMTNGVMTITNCILWGNPAAYGPEIFDFSAYPAMITYSDVRGGHTGTGNIGSNLITHDPRFVNVPGDDLRLKYGSPCVNVGTATDAPQTDFLGVTRPEGSGVDMGAYEGALTASPTVDFDFTPKAGEFPLEVQFTDLTVPGYEPILSHEWSFGDGSASSTEADPIHIYDDSGYFYPSLKVVTAGEETTIWPNDPIWVHPHMPVAGALGLGLLAAVCAFTGARLIRKKSK